LDKVDAVKELIELGYKVCYWLSRAGLDDLQRFDDCWGIAWDDEDYREYGLEDLMFREEFDDEAEYAIFVDRYRNLLKDHFVASILGRDVLDVLRGEKSLKDTMTYEIYKKYAEKRSEVYLYVMDAFVPLSFKREDILGWFSRQPLEAFLAVREKVEKIIGRISGVLFRKRFDCDSGVVIEYSVFMDKGVVGVKIICSLEPEEALKKFYEAESSG